MSTAYMLRSVAGAAVLGQLARTEASAMAGDRGTFTGFIQSASVCEALWFVKMATELAGCKPLSTMASRAIYFSPVVISYFVGKRVQNGPIRNALIATQNLLNPLCQTAAAVSCVALIWFGSPVAGTAGLLVLSLGFAERRQWIGPKSRETLRTYLDPTLSVMGLLSGDWLTVALCGLDLACHYSAAKKPPPPALPPENVLTHAKLKALLPTLQRFTDYHAEFYKACASGCRIGHDYQQLPKEDLGLVFRWVLTALFDNADKRFLLGKQLATDEPVDLEAIKDWIERAPLKNLRSHLDKWLVGVDDKDFREEALGIVCGYGEINRTYVHCPTLPPADPSIDIGELSRMVNEALAADRQKFVQCLRTELADDEKYVAVHGSPDKKEDQQLLDQFVVDFTRCITQITTKTMTDGELSEKGYTWLKENLRIMIKALRGLSAENRLHPLIQCVTRLPYCGPGKLEFAEHLVASLTLHMEQIPLRTKILTLLKNERTWWFQRLISQFIAHRFSSPEQQHEYNRLVNQYGGQKLGIRSASATDDELAEIPSLLTPFFERKVQPLWHKKFWLEHTPSHVVDTVMKHIGEKQPISFLELKRAWYQWIDRQQNLEPQKLKREYDRWTLMGIPLVDNDNKYNPALIYALLIDMGIISLPE